MPSAAGSKNQTDSEVLARIPELVKSDIKKVKPNPPKKKSHKPTKIKERIKEKGFSSFLKYYFLNILYAGDQEHQGISSVDLKCILALLALLFNKKKNNQPSNRTLSTASNLWFLT